MKKLNHAFILLLAIAVLSGCNSINKMKQNAGDINYEVTPEVLEAHAGEVQVTIEGSFPEKYFHKNAIVEATPVIVYEGGETELDKVTLQGEAVQANNKVISTDGGSFSYNSTVPFEEGMRKSELILRATATMKGSSVDFEPVKLADGVIATYTLYDNTEVAPEFIPDKFQRVIPESKLADIHYVINRANVRGSELRQEDIEMLKDYLEMVKTREHLVLKGTDIEAYASPDGELDFNDKLSEKRAESAKSFIDREFSRKEMAEAMNKLSTKSTAEDWEGFKELMEKSNIEEKDVILRVLSMYNDPETREQEIRNISAAFEIIAEKILPELRRSKFIVNVDKIGFSDEEILQYIESKPDTLGLEELLYAPTLVEDKATQLKYYKMAADEHPNCFRAKNSIGYTYMHMGDYEAAEEAFKAAQSLQDNDVVKNNLGFAMLAQDELEAAENYFTSMTKTTQSSSKGMGIISITKGEYDRAVNFFGREEGFNHALALVLKGDLTKGKNMLDNLDADDKGNVSYLKAVVGARMEDKDYMLNNLREAVGYNGDWKDYAGTDMEFGKYFEDSDFMSVVQ